MELSIFAEGQKYITTESTLGNKKIVVEKI